MSVATDRVREVLASAEIDGSHLRLVGQLDRAEYVAVDKVLTAAGGKWDRKARAHVFPGSPMDALGEFLGGGAAPKPARTAEGYVATPDDLADEVVRTHSNVPQAPVGFVALEPSAGDGALVRAIYRCRPDARVVAVEPNERRAAKIDADIVSVQRFEDYATQGWAAPECIVMNPPFALPGEPTAWIDHVRLAWSLLAPGGRLVSIAPAGFGFRQDSRHTAMRELVSDCGGWRDLAPGAFKASGTDVSAVVLWMDAPEVGS